MTTQESTRSDSIGVNRKSDMAHTFPTRKQRMESYKEVDELHTFRHGRLEYSFIPAICDGLKVGRK
jgi:hypothetical protein